ncbi:MAG: type II toxin-antitoxin system HicB family antitoxin [Candidatus Magasanikbacteria bacterium]|nr:type II toxin-antitoxin system HicB family antitoxin [Candidatus Magasanikbacteria bacterium]
MKPSTNQYYITYEWDKKGGYIAAVPAIPGCAVYGKTLTVAHKNIYAAIKECLEVIKDFNQTLPQETITPTIARKFSFVRIPDFA